MFEKIKTVTSKKEVTVEVTVIVRYRLVVIPVAFVGGVAVAIVQVVNMVAVGNRNVAAAFTVLVVVVRMLVMFSALALVPVAFVLTVDVAIVEVVGVVAVWEGYVAAIGAVGVGVVLVGGVGHDDWSFLAGISPRCFQRIFIKSYFQFGFNSWRRVSSNFFK